MGLPSVNPWAVVLVIGVPAVAKIVIVMWSLRGTKPAERPKILTAVADLFPVASWARSRRQRNEIDQP